MARKTGEKPNRHTRAATPPPEPAAQATGEVAGLQPWHVLALATMAAMTAGAFFTTGTPIVNVAFVSVAIGSSALAAVGLYRTLMPLVTPDAGEQIEMLAGRTRAALEREKMLVLRSIKEVEFDRAMRKISEADYSEIVPRLRARAVGLIRQLEGGGGYRALIERDLAALVSTQTPAPPGTLGTPKAEDRAAAPAPSGTCPDCSTVNDKDARFCKSCGTRLTGDV